MSQLLWNLGNLVNDPSTALFQELRLRIFSRAHDAEPTTTSAPRTSTTPHFDVKSVQLSDAACSTSSAYTMRRSKQSESHSIYIQTGSEMRKCRHVGVQCPSSVTASKHHKSTSIQSAPRLDCATDPAFKNATKDARTTPLKLTVCNQHRETVSALRELAAGSNTRNKSNKNKLEEWKSSITKILNLLKLEKIQSIPPYRGTEEEIIKLYRSASLDLNVKQGKKQRTKSKISWQIKCDENMALK